MGAPGPAAPPVRAVAARVFRHMIPRRAMPDHPG